MGAVDLGPRKDARRERGRGGTSSWPTRDKHCCNLLLARPHAPREASGLAPPALSQRMRTMQTMRWASQQGGRPEGSGEAVSRAQRWLATVVWHVSPAPQRWVCRSRVTALGRGMGGPCPSPPAPRPRALACFRSGGVPLGELDGRGEGTRGMGSSGQHAQEAGEAMCRSASPRGRFGEGSTPPPPSVVGKASAWHMAAGWSSVSRA